MNRNPIKKGNLNRKVAQTAWGLAALLLLLGLSGIDAQAKKGPSAPLGASKATGATGTIRGKVIDSANGEPMIGVTAVIKELGIYGITDIDGNYTITNVPVGEQTVTYQITGYQPSATKVAVGTGKAAVANVTLNYKVSSEVVVTAKRVSNTDASLLSKRKKAATSQDAISSEQIAKSPDSDAGDAAKRVTGVTVVGGRTVYIRGLGERYSNVYLNGSALPSPDPNKRVVPLDLFPVAFVDNLVVVKTYSPEYYGEFAGGVLDLSTKDYPEEKVASVSLGTSYNTQTTFKDFLTYSGGATDFLGYDDGTRSLPKSVDEAGKIVPAGLSAGYTPDQLQAFGRAFSSNWQPETTKGPLPVNAQFNFGNSYDLGEKQTLGIGVSGLFKQEYLTTKTVNRRFDNLKTITFDIENLESTATYQNSALLTVGYKDAKDNKLKLDVLYTHTAEKTTRVNTGFGSSGTRTEKTLRWQENDLIFNQMSGTHIFRSAGDTSLEWKASFAAAFRSEPDTRYTTFGPDGSMAVASNANATRYFNKHNELVMDAQPTFVIPFKFFNDLNSKLKVGVAGYNRDRNSDTRRFRLKPNNSGAIAWDTTQPANTSLGNQYINSNPDGFTLNEVTGAGNPDAYQGVLNIFSGFSLVDVPLIPTVRLVAGARAEKWKQTVKSFDKYDSSNVQTTTLSETTILPAANLVWNITNDVIARTSYGRTLNRPDFQESSSFRYEAVTGGGVYEGNPNIKAATLDNYDMRLEWFPSVEEVLSASAFYKQIQNPLENTVKSVSGGSDEIISVANQQKAQNLGYELEFRKNFGFIYRPLEKTVFLINYARIYSEIVLDPVTSVNATNKSRALQGQAPWTVNVGLFQSIGSWGTDASVLLNVNGRRIFAAGLDGAEDAYEESVPFLDATLRQRFGEKFSLKLTGGNLLDPEILVTQFGLERSRFRRGRNIGFQLSYQF